MRLINVGMDLRLSGHSLQTSPSTRVVPFDWTSQNREYIQKKGYRNEI